MGSEHLLMLINALHADWSYNDVVLPWGSGSVITDNWYVRNGVYYFTGTPGTQTIAGENKSHLCNKPKQTVPNGDGCEGWSLGIAMATAAVFSHITGKTVKVHRWWCCLSCTAKEKASGSHLAMVGTAVLGHGTLAIHQETVSPTFLWKCCFIALCNEAIQLTLFTADGLNILRKIKGKTVSYIQNSWLTHAKSL